MNPNNMTGDPGSQGFPFIPTFSTPSPNLFNFPSTNVFQGLVSNNPLGFNIQPQLELDVRNFQFGGNEQNNQHTVQFPFLTEQNQFIGCKRKTDSPPLRPAKQLITEEKMSEHLQNLHISSEASRSTDTEEVKERRLYMCEEMRRLQTETILPPSLLLSSIPRPCTALVLWQPRTGILPLPHENYDENSNSTNNNNNTNSDNVNSTMDLDL